MSSLSSPPPRSDNHHIYLVFCSKDSDQNPNFSNWIARFDPSDNTFSYVSSIPELVQNHVLKDFAMTSIGDSIYIIGGRLCRKDRNFNKFSDVEVEVRPTVLCYTISSDQWSVCAPLNLPRYNFACTVCDNKIYVAGGQYEVASARSTSSVEVYDPTVNKWTQLPNMRRLRYKCVGVTWQGKVHVVGGFVEGCDVDHSIGYVDRCSAEVYKELRGEKRWDLVPGMWQLDVPPNQIVDIKGRLFSSGDCLNAWKGHIEIYDGNLNLWNEVEGSQLKSFITSVLESEEKINRQPMQRLYVTMAPVGTYLYFLAGYKDMLSLGTISVVHRFDTTAKENGWTRFDPSHEEGERQLCSHCCVVTHS